MAIKLSDENYYSEQANKEFCSVSQFKQFIGTPAFEGCESRALAELNGEFVRDETDALLIGSYVDCALTEPDNLEQFKVEHPEMFSTRGDTKGQLKASFKRADKMVERVKKDKKFMYFMTGEHQKIMTGTIFGLPFKIKMDTYRPGKFISDLKTTESIRKPYYSAELGRRVSFIENFDYILQAAIYQEIVFQNTGERLPFYICAVSKEEEPDFAVIQIDNQTLHDRLYGDDFNMGIADQIERVRKLKEGSVDDVQRCENCIYCRRTKVLNRVIDWTEVLGEI